jgi:hypothetical protein
VFLASQRPAARAAGRVGESDPVGHVERVPGPSNPERRAICHDNAVRLLKVDG